MKNWAEPTPEELHEWAYNVDADDPVQDWEIFLCRTLEGDRAWKVFDLIEDHACPRRQFFLLVVYDAVLRSMPRVQARSFGAENYIKSLLEIAREFKDPQIKEWRYKSRLALQEPERFSADTWLESLWSDDTEGLGPH